MKITCESCSAKYTIADDKVRGRKVKIRCKGCGTPIVVDGQQSSVAPNGQAAAPAAPAGSPAPSESPTSVAPEPEWSVNLSDTEQLTLSTQQIVEGWQAGRITADAFVWKDGMSDWVPILESPELAPLLSAPPAAPAQPSAPPAATSVAPAARTGAAVRTGGTAARIAGGRAQNAPDLFAGVERAGSDDEEVATSAPALPQVTTARPEEKATGARNENSVLFSLDALKAGFSNNSSSAKPASSSSSTSEDPFGMSAAPAIPGLGTGNALFSLADNQALLTAPPAPDPPPQAAAAAPGMPSGPAPAQSKKLLFFALAGIGVLGIGLGIGLAMAGGKDDTPEVASAEAPADAKDEKGEKKAAAEEPKDEPKKEEPAQEAAKEEPKKEEGPTEQAAIDPTAKEEGKDAAAAAKPATPPPTTGKSTASKSKDSSQDEPKASANLQPFNKNAAVSALTAAANQAASCKKIGGPTGTGKVTLTFAPSGRVTSANVNGPPFAGTSVGGCVASIFRRAKVPPFSGSSVTVSKSFTIR